MLTSVLQREFSCDNSGTINLQRWIKTATDKQYTNKNNRAADRMFLWPDYIHSTLSEANYKWSTVLTTAHQGNALKNKCFETGIHCPPDTRLQVHEVGYIWPCTVSVKWFYLKKKGWQNSCFGHTVCEHYVEVAQLYSERKVSRSKVKWWSSLFYCFIWHFFTTQSFFSCCVCYYTTWNDNRVSTFHR